ncbi:uncharacterized protein LOC136065553 [Quercus suber]|uniref:uncharacterized protein LOC136065553 n=1 Tax=Quercus suber TaxID=58331 RepID=UPI0032DF1464
MSSPKPDEVLFAYIVVAPYVVSLVLIRVDRGVQKLVYYVSKSLHETEIRYLPLEKAILAVMLGTQKLPHYFQAYIIIVLTQLLLKTKLRSADYTGRIAKWGIILGAFDIKYMSRTSTKGQVLADLVAEFTEPSLEEVTLAQNMDEKSVSRITNRYSTSAYSQGNEEAKAVNKVIVNRLKKRLDDAKGKWVEELPHVLWTYRTTPHRSTRETPFSMTYGTKDVIPLETGFPTLRTSTFSPDSNNELLEKSLDLIEESRKNATIQLAYYQQKLRQGYDANVKLRPLTPNDLVLKKVVGTARNSTWEKLGPNWEGPYRITLEAGIGAFFWKT